MKNPKDLQDQLISLFGKQLFEETEKRLIFGMVYRIPDTISRIPSKKRKKGKTDSHPFVIIKYFKMTNRIVTCALRTSDLFRKGVYTPAEVLPSLDKEGIIVFDDSFSIDAQKFINCDCLGILPEPYYSKLKNEVVNKGWL